MIDSAGPLHQAAAQGRIPSGQDKALRPVKRSKEMLKRDLGLLASPNQLGLTDSQIGQRIRDAQQAAVAGANAQAAEMSQQALAGQGFQRGAMQQAANQLSEAGADAAVRASAAAHDASRQIQEREANRIRNDLATWRNRKWKVADKWLDFAQQNMMQAIGAITTGIGMGMTGQSAGQALQGVGNTMAGQGGS